MVPTLLEPSVSSAVLRCGPSLSSLHVEVPFSDAAVRHITKLPKPTSWGAMNGQPRVSDPSLSNPFPQLETLELLTEASLEWIPFFETISRPASSGQPSNRGLVQDPIVLESRVEVAVDAAFISPIMQLYGLVEMTLKSSCFNASRRTFSLTDDDILEVAIALPRLKDAKLGYMCSTDSCQTTGSSLLSLSTHCNWRNQKSTSTQQISSMTSRRHRRTYDFVTHIHFQSVNFGG